MHSESRLRSTNLFDLSTEYDEMLNRGIRLSSEDKHFFIAGRILDLKSQLHPRFTPRRILDFGCGIGDSTRFLSKTFPGAQVVGVDTAENALAHAEKTYASRYVSFCSLETFSATEAFDLCYVNGVFHHIEPESRHDAIRRIHRALVPGGYFALFENNPWNPGTRLVMRRIPFDHDAKPIAPPEARRLLRAGGFTDRLSMRFLFYFPRPLAFLRFTERWMATLPLGAQYYVLTVK